MSINLSSFFDDNVLSIHVDKNLKLEPLYINERKILFTEPVKFTGNIFRVGENKILNGNLNYKFIETCARCLKEFVKEIDIPVSGKLIESNKKMIPDGDGEEPIYYSGNSVDLTEFIISSIIVSLPMKSLCRSDCKGLCPKCGKNLNEGNCNCNRDDVDPRFAKLKDLFSEN
ncbi:YceD family protein [Sporanaerobacter sp. PP17-6a]|uniref:YceD family protein n=1 Tax=Sporanaerobacter sp. PP17-6a TaxID=1891289 RepID=UPI0008A03C41|nr:DUF177 domain-containing protein [Sporanaerobacter sp. PP17-6a]SCL83314.1 hypothetical protein PP176A_0443 [Sporanaerobacter sp. PP17-6a]